MAVLEVKGLKKIYPTFTLNNVSFALQEGKITGFIGRNGAGISLLFLC
jgi:ABC-2 type transport system ATP-binding protein